MSEALFAFSDLAEAGLGAENFLRRLRFRAVLVERVLNPRIYPGLKGPLSRCCLALFTVLSKRSLVLSAAAKVIANILFMISFSSFISEFRSSSFLFHSA